MLNNNTALKLREMKMSAMARSFENQLGGVELASLSFEERFGLLVDAEYTARKNNRLKRLIRSAGYSQPDAAFLLFQDQPHAEQPRCRKAAESKRQPASIR